ncbi:Acyl-CoA dehydrogenase, short-chain specific [Roseomonas mucosa]|uniref:Acyl-CoA dehydrogenase, short-chain specific n=1 Tax=Roseomonas mucosa TaxID=207340 RepID=A0A379MVR5_9PROT|nr:MULTISPECIES: acyl-CoA dehydrogenase family protein [Roseomonas]MBS5903225.1 acyl-CoA/acyl-ACP dehydrogenase [Acetobacteraceae bacterium]MDT8261668.1 acyl-CoA dehydrogenase family protein [Roseomonas sp. DSM 102946]ATR22785.1 acyl-CoA dehydrogenase [Roseomonas sp. FDAARGOS_362]AWV24184.1 Acyl-CoA dehydrogenase, short-chain specific [Roseomonas mucosa]MCG7353720.1 acyl-CoA/acyl-ACP dehydrogenase [Roseomonas mucosa]
MMDGLLVRPDPLGALVRDFASRAAAHDREGSFPHANFTALHEAGMLGLTARQADGGEEAGLERACALVGRVAEGCPATALVLAMQLIQIRGLVTDPHVPEHIKALVGREAVERGALVNALRVEPELGSPARGGLPGTVARRTAEGWRVSGRKIYSTGAPGLRWMLVWLRTDEERPRIGSLLVRADTPGVRIEESWDQAGLRASGSHDVVFEDALVPLEHAVDLRLPEERGGPGAQHGAWNTLMIAALYTGVARAARDWLVGFLKGRVPANLGRPLATLPRMQEAVGRIEALLATNDRLVDSGARDAGLEAAEAGLIKTVAAENAIAVVQEAVALCGNHALARSNPLERHLRDVLCARIHTPQPDSAYGVAGRRALGVN